MDACGGGVLCGSDSKDEEKRKHEFGHIGKVSRCGI